MIKRDQDNNYGSRNYKLYNNFKTVPNSNSTRRRDNPLGRKFINKKLRNIDKETTLTTISQIGLKV